MSATEVEAWIIPLAARPSPALVSLLSADERVQMQRFVHSGDQRRFCLRRAARRQLLAARCGISPGRLEFIAGPHGKPALRLPSASAPPHFSCSSSHDTALVAISAGGEIGVDLERHRRLGPDLLAMAAAFAPDERDGIAALAGEARQRAFFDCWTRKEAVLKALGCGLARPLDSFSVSLAHRSPRVHTFAGDALEAARWTLATLEAGAGFSATLAARFPVTVVVKQWPGS